MAEIATIARPYAEALFKATTSDLGGTAVWLDELAAIAGNPQLLQFADNPKVEANHVFDVIAGVAKSALPEAAKKLFAAAHRKRSFERAARDRYTVPRIEKCPGRLL
jgi:F-type H+-transporting ATPase subunit delta